MKKMNKKSILMLATMVLLLTFAVGGTIAYIVTSSGPVTNVFTPGTVGTSIKESFDRSVKNDVTVKNTGTVGSYIRAAVVVTWQDADGNVYGEAPVVGTDYRIVWSLEGWTGKSDGFYYYKTVVDPGASTGVLFTGCKPLKAAPAAGYTLHVEILASSIQAEPETVVEGAWSVTVENGVIQ